MIHPRKSGVLVAAAGTLLASWAASSLPACTAGVVNIVSVPGEGGVEAGTIDIDDDGGTVTDAAMPKPDAPPEATNPYGVPYPTQNIGTKVRAGSARGSVIANLKFTGYVPSASTTTSVQLADLFDPKGSTHDIVALLLHTMWDPNSTNMMSSLKTSGLPTRVAVVSVLGEGTMTGTAATLPNLATWRAKVAVPAAWFLLDPSFEQFPTALYDKTAVPAIIILDARTMEIVSADVGAPPQPRQALETFRDQVTARPPAY